MTIPAPTPSIQLSAISIPIELANRHINPLKKKITRPAISNHQRLRPSESLPVKSTKGIISSDGREVRSCISNSVALGKIFDKSPKMGEIANPGNDDTADTDQIANTTSAETAPFPVFTCIGSFSTTLRKPYANLENTNKKEMPHCCDISVPSSVSVVYSFTQRTIIPLAFEKLRSLRKPLCVGFSLLNQNAKVLPSAVQL